MVKERKSNIELMRIVCILLVIAGHYYNHGDWSEGLSQFNEAFLKIFGGGSKLAVNCFVLITGYYGANLKTSRVISLIRDRWFYSILVTIVLLILGIYKIDYILVLQTLFPVLTCRHNYITVFIMLYFFAPFVNAALEIFSRERLKKALLVSTIFLSLAPSIYPPFANNTYAYILWMIYLFIIGRYLKMYSPQIPWKTTFWFSIVVIIFVTLFVEPKLSFLYTENYATSSQYSFLLLVAAVSLFEIFLNINIKQNKIINYMASSTFAVYIIHDDPYVREVIWSKLFKTAQFGESRFLCFHFLVCILVIYVSCVAVDKIYKLTIYRLLGKFPDENLANLIDKLVVTAHEK